MNRRLDNVTDAISQLVNTLFLPHPHGTDANETVSGRCYRQGWYRAERIINAIVFWVPDHCRGAYEKDLDRARRLLGL